MLQVPLLRCSDMLSWLPSADSILSVFAVPLVSSTRVNHTGLQSAGSGKLQLKEFLIEVLPSILLRILGVFATYMLLNPVSYLLRNQHAQTNSSRQQVRDELYIRVKHPFYLPGHRD